jgi:XTP/dITP diphosphohydrolase
MTQSVSEPKMTQYFFASHNRGKQKEIDEILRPRGYALLQSDAVDLPEIEETGQTFIENALIKARAGAAHTGLPTLADDSGLIVPSLNGDPGVRSARYAGEQASNQDNIQKLLAALANTPANTAERDAYFYCVLVFLKHPADPMPIIAQGHWHGRIALAPQGEDGFGYDPIFLTDTGKTAAQLSAAEKHALSHRGKALTSLLAQLTNSSLAA